MYRIRKDQRGLESKDRAKVTPHHRDASGSCPTCTDTRRKRESMPYITVTKPPRVYQLSFDDIVNGLDANRLEVTKDTRDTMTYYTDFIVDKVRNKFDYYGMYRTLKEFNEKYEGLIETADKSALYTSFKIPKRTGGLRQIDAPLPPLMSALTELKGILERTFFFTYHTSAFAYVHGRCTVDAVKRHQQNGSRWILKTDLSKFFPNSSKEFLLKMLYQTFPLSEYAKFGDDYRETFEKSLSLCFLNGGLPQGTPTSPMLTNQMMIPIDHAISKLCHEHKPHLCYTRYADDMDISSQYSFHWTEVAKAIEDILAKFDAPFSFNKEKTHYGSTSGRNWMLGVMLNKDGNITIGHEKKRNFKNMLFAFGCAIKDGQPWGEEDAQHLQGLIAYYKMVEGDPIDDIVNRYSERFAFDIPTMIKRIIKGEQV